MVHPPESSKPGSYESGSCESGSWVSGLAEQLQGRFLDRSCLIGVVGLGYVGLPLARAFVQQGFSVLGFDTDPAKVQRLATGESYIRHLPSDQVQQWIARGQFEPTCDASRLGEPDVLLICVPTPLTPSREPDLSFVAQTADQIAATLRPGQLVVLESTTYPGTTREVVLPRLQSTGLTAGRDFFLGYSPEREDPGNPRYTAAVIPKVVAGLDSGSLQLTETLYQQVTVQTVPVSSLEVAEASKLLENTYRAVNIALVNELKVLLTAMNLDIWEVLAAAATKPFGFQPFYPGPGLGGHCIPIDPFYLSWLARRHSRPSRFIELAGEVNSSMPHYVATRVIEGLNAQRKPLNGSRVLLLGVAYKRDVDDPRESPAFRLMELLGDGGAVLLYHDPYIPSLPAMRSFRVPSLQSTPLSPELLSSVDCALIVTDHTNVDYQMVVTHAPLIVDTRNVTAGILEGRDKILSA